MATTKTTKTAAKKTATAGTAKQTATKKATKKKPPTFAEVRAAAARKHALRLARAPLPSVIRANNLQPAFSHFLVARTIALETATVASAFAAMCDFYESVRVEGRSAEAGTDLLLFQATTSPRGIRPRVTTVNVTRQLYGGAGRSQQLGLDLIFPIREVDLGAWTISRWSPRTSDAGALPDVMRAALGEILAHAVPSRAVGARITFGRF